MPKLLTAVLLAGGVLALSGCVYEEHRGGGHGHKHENHHYKPDKPHDGHKPHHRRDGNDHRDRDHRRSRQG